MSTFLQAVAAKKKEASPEPILLPVLTKDPEHEGACGDDCGCGDGGCC